MREQLSREQTRTLKWSLAPSLATLSATSCAVPVWLPYSTSSGRSASPISVIRGANMGECRATNMGEWRAANMGVQSRR